MKKALDKLFKISYNEGKQTKGKQTQTNKNLKMEGVKMEIRKNEKNQIWLTKADAWKEYYNFDGVKIELVDEQTLSKLF